MPVKPTDLFEATNDSLLSKIFSEPEEELAVSLSLFTESQEQKSHLR